MHRRITCHELIISRTELATGLIALAMLLAAFVFT